MYIDEEPTMNFYRGVGLNLGNLVDGLPSSYIRPPKGTISYEQIKVLKKLILKEF
jgi:hypothetical protein